jgi:hypothetical protein
VRQFPKTDFPGGKAETNLWHSVLDNDQDSWLSYYGYAEDDSVAEHAEEFLDD